MSQDIMPPRNLPGNEDYVRVAFSLAASVIVAVLATVTCLPPASSSKTEAVSIPLAIKGHGIMDIHKGDVALVIYITVASLGHEPLTLSVAGRTCCLEIARKDVDCDSMLLVGGDMGDIYPGDIRNLTVFYPNLYLIDRVGYCEVEIAVPDGSKLLHNIYFNTTVPRNGAALPQFLKAYSSVTDLRTCKSPDQDPERNCKPVLCDVKYNGIRNFYNKTTMRCEPTADCWNTLGEDMVYLSSSNACRRLGEALSDDDMDFFERDSQTAQVLRSLHGYPIKVNCHNGRPDPAEEWCVCNPGWESDLLDYTGFNPDYMVYHMCTVFNREPTATQGHPQRLSSRRTASKMKRGDQTANGKSARKAPSPVSAPEEWHDVIVGEKTDDARLVYNGRSSDDNQEPWYDAFVSKYISGTWQVAVLLPVLAVVVAVLSSLVLGVIVFILAECHKVRRLRSSS